MTYWGLNAFFLAGVVIVGVIALVVARRRARGREDAARATRRASWAVAVGILLVMTAVFDNIMIGIGLVGYDRSKISGVFIGIAPLEDFSYAVAALILLPSLWVLVGGRREVAR
ncbi:lycopene cyclase [Frondihabitans sp. PAMC 28766]|uniref:lycopene cyclase domain-containing protein n=1 Tax=Frondihabitans sp. PAMC 28766 TaxID=1795630 RepID=UPI00078C8975|nr:lycopene cyclase domain-containing protein [Frondihabitans sp. PAMC 28766]AMM19218.1 lycopene cyclase [Frondihabitans sp. PAMC 28766]